MYQENAISASLISSRNILLVGGINPNIVPCLQEVLDSLDLISIECIRKIIAFCVLEVIEQIKNENFRSAGMILNLIHNFPLDEEYEKSWGVDYFLSSELSTFLENFDDIISSRKIVLFVCNQLFTRYFPS